MLEENENMFGETISKEDAEIIDFINERELYYETLSRNEIMLEVEKKFGNKGKEVLSSLNEDILVTPEDLECNECGKMSKEVMDETNEKLKLIDIAFDTEFDKVVEYVIFHGSYDNVKSLKEAIIKFTNYNLGEISDEMIKKVQIKILFNGIQKGWLIDELFK